MIRNRKLFEVFIVVIDRELESHHRSCRAVRKDAENERLQT